MNSLKLITISCAITLSLILLLIIISLLTRHFKSRINNEGKLKVSFAIWYGAIFLAGSTIVSGIITVVIEVMDNLLKVHPSKFYLELVKAITLVLGSSFIWFVSWFMLTKFLIKMLFLKSNEIEEMEDDNIGYFVVKGIILLAIIYSLSPMLSLMLRYLVPTVETPFYH